LFVAKASGERAFDVHGCTNAAGAGCAGAAKWPTFLGGDTTTLTGQQLNWLLDGIDLRYVQPHQTLHYKSAL
jgi:hypothetical protein